MSRKQGEGRRAPIGGLRPLEVAAVKSLLQALVCQSNKERAEWGRDVLDNETSVETCGHAARHTDPRCCHLEWTVISRAASSLHLGSLDVGHEDLHISRLSTHFLM